MEDLLFAKTRAVAGTLATVRHRLRTPAKAILPSLDVVPLLRRSFDERARVELPHDLPAVLNKGRQFRCDVGLM